MTWLKRKDIHEVALRLYSLLNCNTGHFEFHKLSLWKQGEVQTLSCEKCFSSIKTEDRFQIGGISTLSICAIVIVNEYSHSEWLRHRCFDQKSVSHLITRLCPSYKLLHSETMSSDNGNYLLQFRGWIETKDVMFFDNASAELRPHALLVAES